MLELLSLLPEHKRRDASLDHFIRWEIEQGLVLDRFLVQFLLFKETVLDLLSSHVEVVAKMLQTRFELDILHIV